MIPCRALFNRQRGIIMRRTLSLFLLILFLTVSVFPIQGLAQSTEETIFIPIDGQVKTSAPSTLGVFNQRYYNQLDAEQKKVYDSLVGMTSGEQTIEVNLITPLVFYSQTSTPTTAELSAVWAEIKRIADGGLGAFLRDNPIYFWLNLQGGENSTGFSMSYSWVKSGSQYKNTVSKISILVRVAPEYKPNPQQYVTAVNNAVNSLSVSSTTRLGKLKEFHDYLCETVVYDLGATYAHEPYGSLIDGRAVCEGYAEAFKLFCDRFNIPCVLVLGVGNTEDHMWNYVQMEDGKWYAVDVTWDDTPSQTRYHYFLVGSDSIVVHSTKKTFFDNHHEDGHFMVGSQVEFAYPVISTVRYGPCFEPHLSGDWEVSVPATVEQDGLEIKRCLICTETTSTRTIPKLGTEDPEIPGLNEGSSLTVSGGFLLGITEETTVLDLGEEFNVAITVTNTASAVVTGVAFVGTGYTVTVGGVTYTIVIRGDINMDGKVNAQDYMLAKRAILGTISLNTAQSMAARVSGGTTVRAADYLMIKRHFLGTLNLHE